MDHVTTSSAGPQVDAPTRIQAPAVAGRYSISERTAGEWIRAMLAQGVLRRVRRIIVGRWSRIDAWVESGGETRRGRRSAP